MESKDGIYSEDLELLSLNGVYSNVFTHPLNESVHGRNTSNAERNDVAQFIKLKFNLNKCGHLRFVDP